MHHRFFVSQRHSPGLAERSFVTHERRIRACEHWFVSHVRFLVSQDRSSRARDRSLASHRGWFVSSPRIPDAGSRTAAHRHPYLVRGQDVQASDACTFTPHHRRDSQGDPTMTRSTRLSILILVLSLIPVAPASASDSAARRLIAEIRAELAPIENQIRHAPFLDSLERGEVPLSLLRAFAGEQYNIIRSDLRSNAEMASRFGATPGGPFFRDLVNGEALALGYILDFGRALGMSEA